MAWMNDNRISELLRLNQIAKQTISFLWNENAEREQTILYNLNLSTENREGK